MICYPGIAALCDIEEQIAMANPEIKHIVTGCFDESGKLDDSEIVVFGGCIGPGNAWLDLTAKWSARLREDGLDCISMKEAINWEGPFSSWSDAPERRDALLSDLGALIMGAPLMRIASPMTTAEFRNLSEGDKKKYVNPQYCGFEACVLGSLHHRQDFYFNVVCDLSEEYSGKCLKLFHKLRSRNPIIKRRCFGISFIDDRSHYGLQVADMIAYFARAEKLSNRQEREYPIVTKMIDLFGSQGRIHGMMHYRAGGIGLGAGEIQDDWKPKA